MNQAEEIFKSWFESESSYLDFIATQRVEMKSMTFSKVNKTVHFVEVSNALGELQSFGERPAKISYCLETKFLNVWWYDEGSITHVFSQAVPSEGAPSLSLIERFEKIKENCSFANRSLAVHRAESLFKTYFDSEEDYQRFRLEHRVIAHRDNEFESGVAVLDTRPSYEDKPSRVVVYGSKGDLQSSISWSGEGPLSSTYHRPRENGPAEIQLFKDGRVVQRYYEFGKRVKKPVFH